ncbi:MAG TPA: VWA domain-containing protein [Terriglobales bacterium]
MFHSAGKALQWLVTVIFCAVVPLGLLSQLAAQSANANQSATSIAATPGANNESVTTVSVHVNVVNVYASVRDKKGNLVSDLVKDDFALTDNGHPQTIRYFAKYTDQPLTLGLLVDTSLSQRRVLDDERTASRTFLDQMVRENTDKAFIIHFDREVELLQDLTSSRQKLEDALNLLQTPQFNQSSGNAPQSSGSSQGRGGWPGSGRAHAGGGTLLYDAVYLASNELMKKQSGRKAIVILSDGVDRGSKETLQSAIESAQRADTIVYSILFKDDEAYQSGPKGGFGYPGMGGPMGGGMGRHGGGGYPQATHPDGKKILEQMAQPTGGRLFEVSKKLPVDQIYAQIEQELRTQYSLGYTPVAPQVSGDYHKIQVSTNKKDMSIEARDGYYSQNIQ